MTPDRARKLARRWLIGGALLLAARVALEMADFDLLGLPLAGLTSLCLLFSMNYSGWVRGYRDAGRDERDEGEAGDQGD